MQKKNLPTLSSIGVIENDDNIVNRLFLYFLASEFSQTFFYENYVASLKYIIGKYGDDEIEFKSKIIDSLKNMYDRYYENTEVSVLIENNTETESIKKLTFDVITYNGDKKIILSETIKIDSDKIIYSNSKLDDLYRR